MSKRKLLGAGGLFGGKKSNSKPKVVPDSGRSISKGQVIEILASGGDYGIEGLGANPKENVLLDDTPVVANGVENFKGVTIAERKGTPFQLPLQDFNNEVVSEVSVGVTVAHNNPVTRTFVNENCAAIRLRLGFVLTENQKDKDGNVTGTKGTSIQFKVFIRQGNNANFVEIANITQSGKYSEQYEKVWFFNVNTSVDEYSIRIERITGADNDDFRRILRWESYSVVVDTILSFKRLAYAGLTFNAEDFGQSIPVRRYILKGQILQIPSNATINNIDRGLDYTGNWDGNFIIPDKMCRSFLPIIWFLLTDTLDGCGISAANINRFSIYDCDHYNNQFVSVNVGGQMVSERRYLFDFVFNKESTSPYELIKWVCSGCNVRMIEEYGQLTFIQDRPSPIYATLNNIDVENGEFVYSTVDCTEIATSINITWTDQVTGKTRPEIINDPKLTARYGKNTKQIEAVGCSRRTQAIRMARAILFSEGNEIEIVSFSSRDFAAYIPTGSVIAIQDSNLNGLIFGGICGYTHTITLNFNESATDGYIFIVENQDDAYNSNTTDGYTFDIENQINAYDSSTTDGYTFITEVVPINSSTFISFDPPVTLINYDANQFNEEFYITLYPDVRNAIAAGNFKNGLEHYQQFGQTEGRFFNGYLLHIQNSEGVNQIRRITNLPGSYTTLTFTPPLSFVPSAGTSFMVQVPGYSLKLFKIESKEYDSDSVSITAKQYIDTKWDYIENQYSVEAAIITQNLPVGRPLAPQNLKGDYYLTASGFNIEVSWQVPLANGNSDPNISRYYAYFSLDNATWAIRETNTNTFTLFGNAYGNYFFKVVAENIYQQLSDESQVFSIEVTPVQALEDYSVANTSGLILI
jgi:predicted phage tail protein